VRFDNYRDHASSAALYLGAAGPFDVSLRETVGSKAPDVVVTSVPPSARAAAFAAAGAPLTEALVAAPHVIRLDVRVLDPVDLAVLTLDLGVTPAAVVATGSADRVAAPRVRVCR
jgi:hypothetical protein